MIVYLQLTVENPAAIIVNNSESVMSCRNGFIIIAASDLKYERKLR